MRTKKLRGKQGIKAKISKNLANLSNEYGYGSIMNNEDPGRFIPRKASNLEIDLGIMADLYSIDNVDFSKLTKLATVRSKDDDVFSEMYDLDEHHKPSKIYICDISNDNRITELITSHHPDKVEVYIKDRTNDINYMKNVVHMLFGAPNNIDVYPIEYHIQ